MMPKHRPQDCFLQECKINFTGQFMGKQQQKPFTVVLTVPRIIWAFQTHSKRVARQFGQKYFPHWSEVLFCSSEAHPQTALPSLPLSWELLLRLAIPPNPNRRWRFVPRNSWNVSVKSAFQSVVFTKKLPIFMLPVLIMMPKHRLNYNDWCYSFFRQQQLFEIFE